MKHMKKMTHLGIIEGCDSRTPSGFKKTILLRETKNYWVDFTGTKYNKVNGSPPSDFPMYSLDLSTVKTKIECLVDRCADIIGSQNGNIMMIDPKHLPQLQSELNKLAIKIKSAKHFPDSIQLTIE